jgi:hypothetical protein
VRNGLAARGDRELAYTIPHPEHGLICTVNDFIVEEPQRPQALNVMEPMGKDLRPHVVLGIVPEHGSITKRLRTYLNNPFTEYLYVDPLTEDPISGDKIPHSPCKAVFVAVQQTQLRKRFRKFGNSDTYFPLNLRAKINYMLGGTNFDTDVLSLTSSARSLSR